MNYWIWDLEINKCSKQRQVGSHQRQVASFDYRYHFNLEDNKWESLYDFWVTF